MGVYLRTIFLASKAFSCNLADCLRHSWACDPRLNAADRAPPRTRMALGMCFRTGPVNSLGRRIIPCSFIFQPFLTCLNPNFQPSPDGRACALDGRETRRTQALAVGGVPGGAPSATGRQARFLNCPPLLADAREGSQPLSAASPAAWRLFNVLVVGSRQPFLPTGHQARVGLERRI